MSEKTPLSNYDLYRTFYYVASLKSLTKAAKELGVSQPAVSQSMKQLELILDLKLTARTGHGIKLTPEGEIIFPYIKKGCEAFMAGEKALRREETDTSHNAKTDRRKNVKNSKSKDVEEELDPRTGKLCFVTGTQYRHLIGQKLPYRLLEHLPIVFLTNDNAERVRIDSFLKKKGSKIYPIKEYGNSKEVLDGIRHNEGIGCLLYEFAKESIKNEDVYLLEFETEIE